MRTGLGWTKDEEEFELMADCFHETTLAWGVHVVPMGAEKQIELWLPKSLCRREDNGVFVLPLWLAEKHNLT